MYLKELVLTQFKNYAEGHFAFAEGINLLHGKNGAGKTNILDAIHYLSLTRSYFNPVDLQQVQLGAGYFALEGAIANGDSEMRVRLWYQKGTGKKLLVNGNELPRFSDHIGGFPVVMIAPGDIQLIHEGSEARRKLMDLILSQCNPVYLHSLQRYQKILDQRNRLLKDLFETRRLDRSLLEVYNDELSTSGSDIFEMRVKFLDTFQPLLLENYKQLAGNYDQPGLQFESDLHRMPFSDLLRTHEQADFDLNRTTRGIHRDDLVFLLDGQPLKKFGSQGQQKSFLIALKLAQFRYLELQKGIKPVLLLDDIFEKLDGQRLRELFNWIAGGVFGQIFITDTQWERSASIFQETGLKAKAFEVVVGEFTNSRELP